MPTTTRMAAIIHKTVALMVRFIPSDRPLYPLVAGPPAIAWVSCGGRSHSRPAAAVSGGLDGAPRRIRLATGLVGHRCGRAAG
jgi:hypothetical protein